MIINAPIDSIHTAYEEGWMKDKVHNNIVQQWYKWLGNHYLLSEDDTKLHDLIQGLWEKYPAGAYLSTEYIQQTILKSSLAPKQTATAFLQIGNGGITILCYEDTEMIQVLGNKRYHGIPFSSSHLTISHCTFIFTFIFTINRKCLCNDCNIIPHLLPFLPPNQQIPP